MTGRDRKLTWLLRIAAFSIGMIFVLLGVLRGEHLEVFAKAVRICLECIGIGLRPLVPSADPAGFCSTCERLCCGLCGM